MATNERVCRWKKLMTGALEESAPHVRIVPTHDISHLPHVVAGAAPDGVHFGDEFNAQTWDCDIHLLLHGEAQFCTSHGFC